MTQENDRELGKAPRNEGAQELGASSEVQSTTSELLKRSAKLKALVDQQFTLLMKYFVASQCPGRHWTKLERDRYVAAVMQALKDGKQLEVALYFALAQICAGQVSTVDSWDRV